MWTGLVLASVLLTGAPTNLEIAEEAVVEACRPIPDSLLAAGIDAVTLQVTGDHPAGWLVMQCATAGLTGAGVAVTSTPSERGGGGVTLSINPMELSVVLGRVTRPWLVGAKRIDRSVSCELFAQAVDSSGTVMLSMRSSSYGEDRIPFSDLADLQGSSGETWLTGGTPGAETGSLLEPLVVTGVVASLIYLFYSSRAE